MASPIPSFSLPARNRRILLAQRPTGIPQASDFAFDEAPQPSPGDGEFLIRNIYLSVDPAQRGWALGDAGYVAAVPLGAPMRALAVGQVIRSRAAGVAEGEFLYGWFDWQDWCVATPDKILRRVDPSIAPLSMHAGLLGINGLTAYIAFTKLARPAPQETVLVTTAAGAVGSLVGQIARKLGCRTVGLTGDDDKVAACTQRFGYDAALNYRRPDVAAALQALHPKGIDIFFDNVGGPMLDLGLRQMRTGGRVIQCGTASISSWNPPPTGPRNEREVLSRQLTWSGFVLFSHRGDFDAAAHTLAAWLHAGEVTFDEDISSGIEAAPDSIRGLYAGENKGKKLIYIGQ